MGVSMHDRAGEMALPSRFSFQWKKTRFECRLEQREKLNLSLAATFGHLPYTAENPAMRREFLELIAGGGKLMENMALDIAPSNELRLSCSMLLEQPKLSVIEALAQAATQALLCMPYIEACLDSLRARPFTLRAA